MDSAYHVDILSSQRSSGTSSNFRYNIAIPQDGVKYDRVALTSFTTTKSQYSIRAGFNVFRMIENGINRDITIPIGTYGLNAMKTVLQTLLNTGQPSGWVYTVTYPNTSIAANTGKFTYAVTGNSGIQPSLQVYNYLYRQLGFDKNTSNGFIASSLTSTNYIFLNASPSIIINTTDLINEPSSQLCRVDASLVPDGGTITYTCPHPESFAHVLNSSNTQTIGIAFDDDDYNAIDFNGGESIISLRFWDSTQVPINKKMIDVLDKADAFMKALATKK
jgi:hypothetical protein